MSSSQIKPGSERVQRIMILGKDPFARYWMAQLMMRD